MVAIIRNTLVALVMGMFATTACAKKGGLAFDPTVAGAEAIDKCRREHLRLLGTDIPEEVDRAYLYSKSDMVDVLFAHGEFGGFGPPSSDYQFYVLCTVALGPRESVQRLQVQSEVLFEVDDKDYEEVRFYTSQFTEHLYIRDGSGFSYTRSQPYKNPKLDHEGARERDL